MAIRVLIVDDSALVRRMLREILSSDPMIEVVGHAADPLVARRKIKALNPDVLTLDVEMPKMDGISFLRNLMRLRPMPVVMISSVTQRGASVTLEALALGAIDYVSKPATDFANTIEQYAEEIVAKVKTAAHARVRPMEGIAKRTSVGRRASAVRTTERREKSQAGSIQLIAIGASTGGTEAIRLVLAPMPAEMPGMVVVQHIPKEFSGAFADRLDSCTDLRVKEADDDEAILPGHVYVAPGDKHLTVLPVGDQWRCRLDRSERINQHRPSVDVLFNSVANTGSASTLGIILTGMGGDGARGLQKMHLTGAATIAQDERTSVVWGMPREAIDLDCVHQVLPLQEIPDAVQTMVAQTRAKAHV
jgi:two-component system chemotaxis response regulator CheB